MKKFPVLVLTAACLAMQADAQTKEDPDAIPADTTLEAAPWRISAGLQRRIYRYEHDALQTRAPEMEDMPSDWENGTTDGTGWGLLATIGRGDGWLTIDFTKADYSYENNPTKKTRHYIDATSRDLAVSWSQVQGSENHFKWGSELGFRYIGNLKRVSITEVRTDVATNVTPWVTNDVPVTHSKPFDVTWTMLSGGYFGNWRPFQSSVVQVNSSINFMLGEVEGFSRRGSDTNWTDGVISESYAKEYSLAYGANVRVAAVMEVTKRLFVTIEYRREWLYSFVSTDTGTVMFPDNSDALFIENHNAVSGAISYWF